MFGSYCRKTTDNVMPVCEGYREKVDVCYNKYPGKSLKCSSLVKDYMQCVEKRRKVGHQCCGLFYYTSVCVVAMHLWILDQCYFKYHSWRSK